jgi:UPF0755 protein
MRRALLASGLCAVALCAAAAFSARWFWVSPRAQTATPLLFVVEPGEPLAHVARRLARAGLIRGGEPAGARAFVWLARIAGLERGAKHGEYQLSAALSPAGILQRLVQGRVKTYELVLPDGLRLDEVALRVDAAGIARAPALLRRARDRRFARSLGVPADTLEGYLAPETYRFGRNTPEDIVLRRMVREFFAKWTPGDHARLAHSSLSLHQIVTLASIVEKETGDPAERPRIAAVFHNRLRRGMRLQSDPTVIYGVIAARGGFDGNLRRVDLEADTPYNTYTRAGLPPGPIAGAGMGSIRAVLAPDGTSDLYFVSRNDGTHEFAATLRDHVDNVNRYQKPQARRSRARSPTSGS